MKRFLLLIALLLVVSWLIASHRSPFRRIVGPNDHWVAAERYSREVDVARHRRTAAETRRKAQRALAEAGVEVRQALDEAKNEVRVALDDARGEVRQALHELRISLASDDDRASEPRVHPALPEASEAAEGLPVPIVPGSRVTEAKATPPAAPNKPRTNPGVPVQVGQSTITGRLSATKERAVDDARQFLRNNVTDWLEPEVPRSWAVPQNLLDAMVVAEPRVKSIEKPYGEIFEATLTVDKSPGRRSAIIAIYNRQLVERRLISLGAALAFILVCLAAISGYIRADEATKGYYTNRLRMLAAAGVGASGVILYHMMA